LTSSSVPAWKKNTPPLAKVNTMQWGRCLL
jgi:hypothetical protein